MVRLHRWRYLHRTVTGTDEKGPGVQGSEDRNALLRGRARISNRHAHRARQQIFREEFGSDYRTDLDLIFANPDGTPLKPDLISSSISALFKRLRIQKPKGAALHLLRHSHGSHLLAQNESLTTVSERLGHSSPRVTADIYSHAITGQDREAARKWEEFQRQSVDEHPKQ